MVKKSAENSEEYEVENICEFTLAKQTGEEMGELPEGADIDIDVGKENDFEIKLTSEEWDEETMGYKCRFFAPNTEYGGIIRDIESSTETREVTLRGSTWRGMLGKKIIKPPEKEDHWTLSGELNEVLRTLIGDRFGGLFVIPGISTGVKVERWEVERFAVLYDEVMKLVEANGHKLKIEYVQPSGLEYGYVSIRAEPVVDYSEEIEYSEEGNVNVNIRDCRNGVTHLICAGEGTNDERVTIDLYVQEDGSISKQQYYTGADEIEDLYEYTGADIEKLEEGGIKRLQELQNYVSCKTKVEDMDLEVGDIVAGYDQITNTQVRKPITRKILKKQKGKIKIEYDVKGDS